MCYTAGDVLASEDGSDVYSCHCATDRRRSCVRRHTRDSWGCVDHRLLDSTTRDAGVTDGPTTAPFVSNTPGATVIDVGTPPTPQLVLMSSNLVQQPMSPAGVHQEWFAEVKNVGSSLACQVMVDVTFKSAAGTEARLTGLGFASAAPYAFRISPNDNTIPCIPPGNTGGFYIDRPDVLAEARLDMVTAIEVDFTFTTPIPDQLVLSSRRPSIVSRLNGLGSQFGVAGELAGQTDVIHDILLTSFPRTASGLVLGRLVAAVDSLRRDEVVPFISTLIPISFTDYRVFVEFAYGSPEPVEAK
jgi:hypothetical protein